MRAIAYFRTRHIDAKLSERALLEQRNVVGVWAASHPDHEVIAEYTEDESGLAPRYLLKSAVEDCKEREAFLLIASTEAIGRGQPFYPRLCSVPYIKLPTPQRALGYIKAAPSEAPEGLSLYFDSHAEETVSDIYLCNGFDHCIDDVMASLVGTTANLDHLPPADVVREDFLTRSNEIRHVKTLPPRQMSLISCYDTRCDGDALLVCDILQHTGTKHGKSRAIVQRGFGGGGFVEFISTTEPCASAPSL